MKDSGSFNDNSVTPVSADSQQAAGERSGLRTFWNVLQFVGKILYRLRKLIMALPVGWYALKLAAYNSEHLPALVGINLQSNGEYARMISRNSAVMGPLMATGCCLLLMFFSRKSVYPWLISIFSLVLPALILFTNQYPM